MPGFHGSTGTRHVLAHGTTTQNSCIYIVPYISPCMYSLSIHVLSLLLCRKCIYHVYCCASLPPYALLYIMYPQSKSPLAPTFPRHIIHTFHTALHTYHVI